MKVVIDEDIPFIKGELEPYAEVVYLAGKQISNNDVANADALIVRTRTQCNEVLLKNSQVKYIASATIGYDHIDTAWCAKNAIKWSNAIGCNANSVGQYVLAALVEIAQRKNIDLQNKTIGIVGVGHVGSVVKNIAEVLGMRVLLNDPPRAKQERGSMFVPLDVIAAESDFISFHPPLIKQGEHKTYHLVDSAFLQKLKPNVVIVNTSRGEVIDENALKQAIVHKSIAGTVIDVWENEPNIDAELLQLADIATPHIAGYSTDGKARATEMVVQAVSRFFSLPLNDWKVKSLPIPEHADIILNPNDFETILQLLHYVINFSYNILVDDLGLRNDIKSFENLRKHYRLRREFPSYTINVQDTGFDKLYCKSLLSELGFILQ